MSRFAGRSPGGLAAFAASRQLKPMSHPRPVKRPASKLEKKSKNRITTANSAYAKVSLPDINVPCAPGHSPRVVTIGPTAHRLRLERQNESAAGPLDHRGAPRYDCKRCRGCGGTGRRAGFRFLWAIYARGGSTPLTRTFAPSFGFRFVNAATASPNSIDPEAARRFAIDVVRRLQQAGHQAYWAGGCVRDWLLGLRPKDYDVATSAPPQQIRELFGWRRTIPLGQAFGIITVLGPRRAGQVEVATFRRDSPYTDGRHPDSVEFASAEEDARRRDFTINGLFFDPLTDQVIDYVGGQADLEKRILRAIGDPDRRLSEDWLRMLRAVRFAACYQLTPDPATAAAVRRHAAKITGISAERISAEVLRMLVDPKRRRAVELLQQWGLLAAVLPESAPLVDSPRWESALQVLARLETPDEAMALAALIEPLVTPRTARSFTRKLARRWRLSNAVRDELVWLLETAPILDRLPNLPWSALQPVVVHPYFPALIRWMRARWETKGRDTAPLRQLEEKRRQPREQLDPPPLLTGDDLRRWGWEPGPRFAEVLRQVRTAQLDGQIQTQQEARQLAESVYRRLDSQNKRP